MTTTRPEGAKRHLPLWLKLLPTAVCAGLLVVVWWWTHGSREPAGRDLNQRAWEASYTERGQPVPESPREGYWAERLHPKSLDSELGWRETAISLPPYVVIDDHGRQSLRCPSACCRTLLVIGGSVAFGTYASVEGDTWFANLAQKLADRGLPVETTVVAAGAWKSVQEVLALERELPRSAPDLVLFVSGLNDVLNASRADALHFRPDGSIDGPHQRDFEARARLFAENAVEEARLARAASAEMVLGLQPALFAKEPRSALEDEVLRASLTPDLQRDAEAGYALLREQVRNVAPGRFDVADCSNAFQGEEATSFADLWHFGDAGHAALAECLLPVVEAALAKTPAPRCTPPP